VRTRNHANEEDIILVIRIRYRPDKVVETTDGNAWIRRGSSKKRLTDDEKRELKAAKGQVDVELEPVSLRFPDDFRLDLIKQFVDAVRPQRRMSANMSAEEVLTLRHLGARKQGAFEPNLACALLFAKDPQAAVPGCRIRFLRYNGTVEKTGEQYNVIKDEWIEGTVAELIANAEQVLDSQLREFQKLGKDNKFYAVPEYPKPAWYEAIVNACVHRSCGLRTMNIFIKMFDDRLVVESPGGFPPFVTPQNIYEMHAPRNPWLMDALFYLRFVQCAHEGTSRIRDYMRDHGLPAPIFSQQQVGNALVQVTLKNDVEHRREFIDTDAFRILGEELSNTLNDNERRIVNFIAENRTINVSQAMNLVARRWHRCKKILSSLVERGILDHVHDKEIERDRNQYYTLKKKFSDRIMSP